MVHTHPHTCGWPGQERDPEQCRQQHGRRHQPPPALVPPPCLHPPSAGSITGRVWRCGRDGCASLCSGVALVVDDAASTTAAARMAVVGEASLLFLRFVDRIEEEVRIDSIRGHAVRVKAVCRGQGAQSVHGCMPLAHSASSACCRLSNRKSRYFFFLATPVHLIDQSTIDSRTRTAVDSSNKSIHPNSSH